MRVNENVMDIDLVHIRFKKSNNEGYFFIKTQNIKRKSITEEKLDFFKEMLQLRRKFSKYTGIG